MKKSILLIASFFISAALFSQTLSNQLLGYQEPYSQMQAQVTDSSGNVYYAGTFKGALVIDSQTVFTSNGGEDVFVVKMNAAGELVWAKKFGDTGAELFSSLVFHKGSLYMSMMIYQASQIGGSSYDIYPLGNNTSLVLKIDITAGGVQWGKKNSLPFVRLMPSSDIIYMHGVFSHINAGALYFEENLLEASAAINRTFFLYVDTSGNFKGHKLLTSSQPGLSSFTLISSAPAANNKLIFLLNTATTETIQFGSQTVNFPVRSSYQLLIKTDTSLSDVQYKILNPNGEGYGYNLWLENKGFTVSEKGDSLLFVLAAPGHNAGNYKLDGYDIPMGNQSLLVVMDTNFVTAKAVPLTLQNIDGFFLRLGISHVTSDSNYYYFLGRVAGDNNSLPIRGIVPQKREVQLLYGLKDTFDFAGPSRSFIVKAKKDFSEKFFSWLGYHIQYESPTVTPAFFTHRKGKLFFLHTIDNVWNPWVIDTSLNLFSGAMKNSADRGETTNYVSYFSDGSKAIVGLAKGKTALDVNTTNIISNQIKSDLFLVGMTKNDNVSWYKRLYHSFGNLLIQKVTSRNEMVYVSFSLLGPRNLGANNYIGIDSSVHFITPLPPQTSGFLVIDKNGKVKLILLPAPFNNATIFDVFSDGSMAIVSSGTSNALAVPGKSFINHPGIYVAKIDTSGAIKDAIQFSSNANTTMSSPTDIIIDTATNSFKILWVSSIAPSGTGNSFTYNNGLNGTANYTITNPQPSVTGSKLYLLITNSNFGNVNSTATIGPLNSTVRTNAQIDNKIFLLLGKSNLTDSIYYNNNLIIPDNNSTVRFILGMDTALNYYKHRVLNSTNEIRLDFYFNNLKAYNNTLYASGSNLAPVVFDTINIGNAGLSDAITVQFDTTLIAKRMFRVASPYNETMLGCDIYKDSIISFAYTSQGSPILLNSRMAARNSSLDLTDLDENAYIQTVLLKTGVITSVDEPLRVEGFKLFPNPVRSNLVFIDLGNTEAGRYQWMLYNTEGRLIESNMLMWNPGQTKQIQFSNRLQAGNYVLVIKSGQQRITKAVKLTVL